MKNTNQISMATLRDLCARGEINEGELESIRLNRDYEQQDIRQNERELFVNISHPQRDSCCPIRFAQDLRRPSW
jgi:hypothetical protein